MFRASLLAAVVLLAACSAPREQYIDSNVDWRESEIPAAPAFDVTRLIPIDAPRGSSLEFGIDPETISLGDDGVVRYVVVASSARGVNTAIYEGIRCGTGEFRAYARHNPESGWSPADDSQWKSVFAPAPSRHPLAIARAGVCDGKAPNGPSDAIIRALRGAPQWRRGPIQ